MKVVSVGNLTYVNNEASRDLHSQDYQQEDKDGSVLKTQLSTKDDKQVDEEIEVEEKIFQVPDNNVSMVVHTNIEALNSSMHDMVKDRDVDDPFEVVLPKKKIVRKKTIF